MTKSKAVWLHIKPSAVLLLIIAILIVFAWYPYPFLQFKGALTFPLMLVVAATLAGPAMTWVVFRPGKWGLKFDLIVIVIVQLCAMGWGTVALYKNRPYFMVYTVDRFEVFSQRKIDMTGVPDKWVSKKPYSGPLLLFANMPLGSARSTLVMEVMLEGKPDLQFRPEFWSLYPEKQEAALSASKPLQKLRSERPAYSTSIDQLVQQHGGEINQLNFVPGTHQYGQFAAILNADSGELIDTIIIDPWVK